MAKFTLAQSERIKKRREFLELQKNGTKIYTKNFVVVVGRRRSDNPRLGITVTTKVAKRANVRNLIKRRVRELFRTKLKYLLNDYDVVVVARSGAPECSSASFREEILKAVQGSQKLKRASEPR